MLLSLIIIVALIGAAVVGNIYSNFLVFYSNFSETENYNKAYYASIAGIERAELVTKQRKPGFEGQGGWENDYPIGWGGSDGVIGENFSYLSRDSGINSSSRRDIDSLTNSIPPTGQGDVDRMLSTGDSENFNMMDYNNSEIALLYYDPYNQDTDNPYAKLNKEEMLKATESGITGTIRLPAYLYPTFGLLDTRHGLAGDNKERNDVIVDRQVMGKYNGTQNNQFTIFSSQRTLNGSATDKDTTFRESDLNNPSGFTYNFNNDKNPKSDNSTLNERTIISPDSTNITGFQQIFSNNSFSQVQLKFSLLNQLKNSAGDLYPFLEYVINANETQIPDKYYTINANGAYGDYQVHLTIHKPTIQRSILKSFTTIF